MYGTCILYKYSLGTTTFAFRVDRDVVTLSSYAVFPNYFSFAMHLIEVHIGYTLQGNGKILIKYK